MFDVRNRKNVVKEIQSIPNEFSKIDILINNAGNAHCLDDSAISLDDWDLMIDTNLKALCMLPKQFHLMISCRSHNKYWINCRKGSLS